MAGEPLSELADVHLGHPATSHDAHGQNLHLVP